MSRFIRATNLMPPLSNVLWQIHFPASEREGAILVLIVSIVIAYISIVVTIGPRPRAESIIIRRKFWRFGSQLKP
jgi:hypothetical protein